MSISPYNIGVLVSFGAEQPLRETACAPCSQMGARLEHRGGLVASATGGCLMRVKGSLLVAVLLAGSAWQAAACGPLAGEAVASAGGGGELASCKALNDYGGGSLSSGLCKSPVNRFCVQIARPQ
jgi:hypothetical protein